MFENYHQNTAGTALCMNCKECLSNNNGIHNKGSGSLFLYENCTDYYNSEEFKKLDLYA